MPKEHTQRKDLESTLVDLKDSLSKITDGADTADSLTQEDQYRYYSIVGEISAIEEEIRDRDENSKYYKQYGTNDQVSEFVTQKETLVSTGVGQITPWVKSEDLGDKPELYKGSWFNTYKNNTTDEYWPKAVVRADNPVSGPTGTITFNKTIQTSLVFVGTTKNNSRLVFRNFSGRRIYMTRKGFDNSYLCVVSIPST